MARKLRRKTRVPNPSLGDMSSSFAQAIGHASLIQTATSVIAGFVSKALDNQATRTKTKHRLVRIRQLALGEEDNYLTKITRLCEEGIDEIDAYEKQLEEAQKEPADDTMCAVHRMPIEQCRLMGHHAT